MVKKKNKLDSWRVVTWWAMLLCLVAIALINTYYIGWSKGFNDMDEICEVAKGDWYDLGHNAGYVDGYYDSPITIINRSNVSFDCSDCSIESSVNLSASNLIVNGSGSFNGVFIDEDCVIKYSFVGDEVWVWFFGNCTENDYNLIVGEGDVRLEDVEPHDDSNVSWEYKPYVRDDGNVSYKW